MPENPPNEALAALPKVLLHDHLDGSLRVSTLLDLCARHGLRPPAADEASLGAWFEQNAMAGSLERYLEGFGLTVAALADLESIERVAHEAAVDAHADGCVLAEFRMAPLLLEAHGLDPDEAVRAMLRGLSRGPMPCGLILCGMRQHSPSEVMRTAELALRHFNPDAAGSTVVGFDLAGPERGFPATVHRAALQRVAAAGLPITLHAGEADEGSRVLEAVELGARRIGHGVRLADLLSAGNATGPEAPALLAALRDRGVHLEICPTSNVQTGAATSIATHPIRALWQAGVSLSFHTDNRLISCTTQSREAQLLIHEAGFSMDDLYRMQQLALQASFLSEQAKVEARRALRHWADQHRRHLTAHSEP